MPFDAKLIITGICAFVPDKEISLFKMPPYRDAPEKMWVLLPEARRRKDKKTALDGRDLTTHYPVLSFKTADLEDGGSVDLPNEITTPILFYNLVVIPEPETAENKFEVIQDESKEDFRHGAHIREASLEYVDIDPECFKDQGKQHKLVGSRILLTRGKVKTHELNDKQEWQFSDTLGGGGSAPRLLSNQVSVNFTGLTRLTLRLTPFGSENKRDIVFSRSTGIIRIENICGECMFPDLNQEEPVARRKDEDFRWLFELCRDRKGIHDRLDHILWTSPLPVPERVGDTSGGGSRLVECMRMTYAAFVPANNPKGVVPPHGSPNLAIAPEQARVQVEQEINASTPYHRQSSDFKCGAAAAMMILVDGDVGGDIGKIDQESIYTYASGLSLKPWHINPSALAAVLNKISDVKDFVVNRVNSFEDASRDIVAAMIQHNVSPAVVTEEDDHWVGVNVAVVDSDPLLGDFVLYGFRLNNPWCRGHCPSSHSADDDCGRYGTPCQEATYWDWEKNFREISWKEDVSTTRKGFTSITRTVTKKVGHIKKPKKVLFSAENKLAAIQTLRETALLAEKEAALLPDSVDLVGPLSVSWLGDDSKDYILYGFVRDGEVIAQTKVAKDTHLIMRFQFENEDSKEWSVFSEKTQNLGKTLQALRDRSPREAKKKRDSAESLPPLVWRPCDESRTPFLPFFDLSEGATKVYLRVDGMLPLISELTLSGSGG